jgi:hypothetical protein
LQAAQSNAQTQACKRASTFATRERISKFFLPRLKKNKKRNAQPDTDRQKRKRTMTLKPNTDNGLQRRADRTPAANSVLPQLAVTCKIEAECSYQTFVPVDSEVLRNRQLRQHAKRCGQCIQDITSNNKVSLKNEKRNKTSPSVKSRIRRQNF